MVVGRQDRLGAGAGGVVLAEDHAVDPHPHPRGGPVGVGHVELDRGCAVDPRRGRRERAPGLRDPGGPVVGAGAGHLLAGAVLVGRLDRVGVRPAVVVDAGVVARRRGGVGAGRQRLAVAEHGVAQRGWSVGVDRRPGQGDRPLVARCLLVGDRRRRRGAGRADRLELRRHPSLADGQGVLGSDRERVDLVVVEARDSGLGPGGRRVPARPRDLVATDVGGLRGRRAPGDPERAVALLDQRDRPDPTGLGVGGGLRRRRAPFRPSDGVVGAHLECVVVTIGQPGDLARRAATLAAGTMTAPELVAVDRRTVGRRRPPVEQHLLVADRLPGHRGQGPVGHVEDLEHEAPFDLALGACRAGDVAHHDPELGAAVDLGGGGQPQARGTLLLGGDREAGELLDRDDRRLGVVDAWAQVRREVDHATLRGFHVVDADRVQRGRRRLDDADLQPPGVTRARGEEQGGARAGLGGGVRVELDGRAAGLHDRQPVDRGLPVGVEREPAEVGRVGCPDVAQRGDVELDGLVLGDPDRLVGATQDRCVRAHLYRHRQHREDAVGVVDRRTGSDLEAHRARADVALGGGEVEGVVTTHRRRQRGRRRG